MGLEDVIVGSVDKVLLFSSLAMVAAFAYDVVKAWILGPGIKE